MKSWTPEERAAHGAKIRAAVQRKRAGTNGRLVVMSRPRVGKANKFGTELERAIKALDLVDRIGWDLAEDMASRMK